jgi:hypothetical protein
VHPDAVAVVVLEKEGTTNKYKIHSSIFSVFRFKGVYMQNADVCVHALFEIEKNENSGMRHMR